MHNARAIWTYFQMHDDVDELVHWTQYAFVCGNIAASILEREKKNWFVTLQWPAVWQAGNASIGSCNIHYSQCSGSHELHVIRGARCVYVNDLRPSALFQFNASSWVKVTENRWNEYHPFSVTAIATYSVGRYEYQHRLSTFRRCEGPPHPYCLGRCPCVAFLYVWCVRCMVAVDTNTKQNNLMKFHFRSIHWWL